jgi:hypothetical protein
MVRGRRLSWCTDRAAQHKRNNHPRRVSPEAPPERHSGTTLSVLARGRPLVISEMIETGPMDYVVVELPGNETTGQGLPLLLQLVDPGIIRILDLGFVKREIDDSVRALEIAGLDADGEFDLAVLEGASSGLLEQDDVDAEYATV